MGAMLPVNKKVVKKFLKRVAFFVLLPLLVAGIAEAFILPPNFFTYRTWEAIIYKNPIPHTGNFYPDMHINMNEQGDLAFRTSHAIIKKNVQWDTDKLGYRNDEFIEEADVLLIGDSFVAGIALSQDETIAKKLNMLLGKKVKVYNMAPCTLGEFNFLYKQGIVKKPKLIIYSAVERILPSLLTVADEEKSASRRYYRKVSSKLVFSKMLPVVDRFFAFNFLKWATGNANQTRIGHQSPFNSSLFFMQGNTVKHYTLKDAENTAATISSYNDYCQKEGIKFLFMPMPNKETIYYSLVPLQGQPQFLFQLDSLLNKAGIPAINTLSLYNSHGTADGLLYKPDDTHWNEKGVGLVAEEVVKHRLLKELAVK